MFRFLLLILALSSATAVNAQDRLSPNELHALRSTAFMTSSNLLLYYSAGGYGGDPRYLAAYRDGMSWLAAYGARSGDAQVREALLQMADQVVLLERNKDADRLLKPRWVIPILQTQAQLDARLASLQTSEQVPAELHLLQEQSLDVNRILLMYQIRAFGSLAVYFMDVDESTPQRIDTRITEGFGQLTTHFPERAQDLGELARRYQFIRVRLLQGNDNNWIPVGAEYQLGRVVETLDQMATQSYRTLAPAS